VSSAPQESEAMIRLNAVAGTLDGFELSRIDLEQRSEGDVLGKAQSGVRSHLRLLKVLRDEPLIEKARSVAIELVSKDATLASMPELAAEVAVLGVNEETDFMDKG